MRKIYVAKIISVSHKVKYEATAYVLADSIEDALAWASSVGPVIAINTIGTTSKSDTTFDADGNY